MARRDFVAIGILLLALANTATSAAEPARTFVDADGVALGGHDPVAYFTEGRPIVGGLKFTATHEGATYRFASESNRDAFVKEPSRYLPQYGGFCAYGVAVGGKYPIDPRAFRIVEGKLYLNKTFEVQKIWEKDVPGNIRKADEKWPALRDS